MAVSETNRLGAHVRNLDSPVLVAVFYLASIGLLLLGAIRSAYEYTDPRFVVDYFGTELQVAVLLLFATIAFFPAARIGLRGPELENGPKIIPLAIVFAVAIAGWIVSRLTVPAEVSIDSAMSLRILRTTLFVGVTEEWMYRGLLFVSLSRWLGLRRGAYSSLLLFGALHLLNIAAGVAAPAAIIQFFMSMLAGGTFLLAAVGTRSLVVPIVAHGFYDFFVIDAGRFHAAGAISWTAVVVLGVNLIVGIFCMIRIARLEGKEPFSFGELQRRIC